MTAISRERGVITVSWVNTAILSAAVLGAVNIVDSHLLSKRMPGLQAFLLPVGIIHLIYGVILLVLFPLPEGTGPLPIVITVVSGILRTGAVTIMLYSLQREEVSLVIPVVYTYPIFVAIIAAPLLGESLGYLGWLAITIVVAGAVIISARETSFSAATFRSKPLLLLLGSSLLFALADITSKYALSYISFWNMFSLSACCMSGTFLLLSMRPHTLRQLYNMKRRNSAMGLLVFNETLAPLGNNAVVLGAGEGACIPGINHCRQPSHVRGHLRPCPEPHHAPVRGLAAGEATLTTHSYRDDCRRHKHHPPDIGNNLCYNLSIW